MSQFFWYLDIQESSFANMNEIDPPEMNAGPRGTFSVGPIRFSDNETLSVVEFIDRIDDAFEIAFAKGVSPHRYYIEARLRPLGNVSGLDNNKINTALARRELVVEYRIFNNDNVGFTVQFRSGEHGVIGGVQLPVDGVPSAEVTVANEADIVAFATPYCSVNATITDKPPVPPDIVFVPYVGVNNKVMILFNSNAGEKKEYPIMLRPGDTRFVLDEYFAQHRVQLTAADASSLTAGSGQEKLQYRNDDPIRKYELFRVDRPPNSYKNFVGRNLTEFPIQAEIGPDKFSTAVAFVDTIKPNKKYWYCARSIDIHNNISNPTYIFELEMVDNKGQMFMRHKVFAFKPGKMDYKKKGRRFLAIEPRYEQMLYDEEAESPGTVTLNEAPSSNILGSETVRSVSSVWGKKFKVRVTSKKTGRKIDLNVTFKNTGVVIP